MSELIFYDVPGTSPEKAWSPNTWIIRLALNYKGLKYRTEWVEFPDISTVCQKIGAPSTGVQPDGSTPFYTVPVLADTSNQKVISDTSKIADYLEKTYPDTPRLFPPSTRGLHAAFGETILTVVGPPLYKLCVLAAMRNLNEASVPYFRVTREMYFGAKLEEICPEGEVAEATWKELEGALSKIAGWFKAAGDSPFIGGDELCYADFQLVAPLIWARTVWGADSEHRKRLDELDEGRWARYIARFEQYRSVL